LLVRRDFAGNAAALGFEVLGEGEASVVTRASVDLEASQGIEDTRDTEEMPANVDLEESRAPEAGRVAKGSPDAVDIADHVVLLDDVASVAFWGVVGCEETEATGAGPVVTVPLGTEALLDSRALLVVPAAGVHVESAGGLVAMGGLVAKVVEAALVCPGSTADRGRGESLASAAIVGSEVRGASGANVASRVRRERAAALASKVIEGRGAPGAREDVEGIREPRGTSGDHRCFALKRATPPSALSGVIAPPPSFAPSRDRAVCAVTATVAWALSRW